MKARSGPGQAYPGQSLVEFVLMMTLLVVILVGMVDFARAYSLQVAIDNAVAEGAYWLSQNPGDTATVSQRIVAELDDSLPGFNASNVTLTTVCGTNPQTTIRVDYQLSLLFDLVVPSARVNLYGESVIPQLGC